jgi:hypothetical protein
MMVRTEILIVGFIQDMEFIFKMCDSSDCLFGHIRDACTYMCENEELRSMYICTCIYIIQIYAKHVVRFSYTHGKWNKNINPVLEKQNNKMCDLSRTEIY